MSLSAQVNHYGQDYALAAVGRFLLSSPSLSLLSFFRVLSAALSSKDEATNLGFTTVVLGMCLGAYGLKVHSPGSGSAAGSLLRRFSVPTSVLTPAVLTPPILF
eukprot:543990-Prymnesium_polylepis.1